MSKWFKKENLDYFKVSEKDTENAVNKFMHLNTDKIKIEVYFSTDEINRAWGKALEEIRGQQDEQLK